MKGSASPAGVRRSPVGWDHPATARAYQRFDLHSNRYRRANEELVAQAGLVVSLRVLDLGAGGGGTAAAALPYLGREGSVVCFEPAAAMQRLGRAAVSDPRVEWTSEWPSGTERFDRILCGAAVWQMVPLEWTFQRAHESLRAGGLFCFDIPALYLGEPDPPGGGRDPLLLGLPAALAREDGGRGREHRASDLGGPASWAGPGGDVPGRSTVEAALARVGFRARMWSFVLRFSQAEYREWLKIPPTTDGLLPGMTPHERARRIDRAYPGVDPDSWRWERWLGWTARKPGP